MTVEAWAIMIKNRPHSVYLDRYQAEYEARQLVRSGWTQVSLRTLRSIEQEKVPILTAYFKEAEPEGPAP